MTLPRRTFLTGAVAAVAAVACGDDPSSDGGASPTSAAGGGTAVTSDTADLGPAAATTLAPADFDALATCVLLPEQTAGPFPLDEQFDRRDVTEGLPGHPLRLGLRVVDAACEAVTGAAVEIWHADASGDYSAFTDGGGGKDEAEGTTFLRGTQTANDDGIVEFLSIYPGWYTGRAVHVHLRVHVDESTVLTSQLYFDDAYTADVHADDPYAEFGPPDTSNEQDAIAGDPAADGTLLVLAEGDTDAGPGTLALLNLGVQA